MNPTCRIEGCAKPWRNKNQDICGMHYHRFYRHGDYYKTANGSGITASQGRKYKYIYQPGHIMSGKRGMAYEHRIVLFDAIGYGPHRCQWCSKVLHWGSRGKNIIQVDHIDGDGANNKPENLAAACGSCNVARGQGKRHEALRAAGWFSANDTVAVTDGRKYNPETMEPVS